jgi:excisionase family DNA binding protein
MRSITIDQAVTRYGLSRATLYRYARDGRITAHHIGERLVRLDVDELDREFHGELISST